jgi:hypothetical protein
MQTLLDKLTVEERWSDLVTWSEHWIAFGQTPEPAYLSLMTGHAGLGDLAGVATSYRRCEQALEEEIGVEPSAETKSLFERLSEGEQLVGKEVIGPPDRTVRTRRLVSQGATQAEPQVSPRHNLPVQTTRLVGRQIELADVADLIADPNCRLVTLVGAGGVGKTRLAIAAAEAQVNRFQNGVVFVPLVGVSARDNDEAVALLIDQIANAIDFNFSAQLPPRELLFNHLASKETLLLLDNFEQLRGAAPFLVDLVSRTVDIKLLITSRERLGVQPEWLYEVHGLRYPSDATGNDLLKYAAVELFTQRARQLQPDFSPVVESVCITRICRVVEGSPLGLELAANWTRSLAYFATCCNPCRKNGGWSFAAGSKVRMVSFLLVEVVSEVTYDYQCNERCNDAKCALTGARIFPHNHPR